MYLVFESNYDYEEHLAVFDKREDALEFVANIGRGTIEKITYYVNTKGPFYYYGRAQIINKELEINIAGHIFPIDIEINKVEGKKYGENIYYYIKGIIANSIEEAKEKIKQIIKIVIVEVYDPNYNLIGNLNVSG